MEDFGKISPEKYVERMEFLSGATRRYFKLAKEIYGEKEWVPKLIEYLLLREQSGEMEPLKWGQYHYRAVFHDPDLRDDQGRLLGNSSLNFEQWHKQTIIGLYFPPEDYPLEEGKYPKIPIAVNDTQTTTIELDGTHKIHKPLGNIYWFPAALMHLYSLHVYARSGKPFYSIQIEDSLQMNDDWNSSAFWFLIPRQSGHWVEGGVKSRLWKLLGSGGFSFKESNDLTKGMFLKRNASQLQDKHANIADMLRLGRLKRKPIDSYALTYPYEHAANVIKRGFQVYIERKRQKHRDRIGFVIRALPGGTEAQERGDRYSHWG